MKQIDLAVPADFVTFFFGKAVKYRCSNECLIFYPMEYITKDFKRKKLQWNVAFYFN